MHPDQYTPEGHRTHEPDSLDQADAPEQDQSLGEGAETPRQNVSTPEPEGGRTEGEQGNAYTGRQMDDALKANPRTEPGGEGTERQHPDEPAEGAR